MPETTGGDDGRVQATIDGRPVSAPRGTTILRAAEELGIRIPHYCFHPGIPTAPAQCRLCLVDVEGAPKPLPACTTTLQDGAVVRTAGGRARRMREGVLEFYLVNHPLDCPVCDQSGECQLQDYVHAEGRKHGRSREPKRVFGRDDFGGDVLFHADRCVLCTRCVRFMNEVARDPRLCVVERGDRSIIDTFFEHGLEGSPFAGNIVDICPVGALVSKDFLHRARAWDLDRTPSVCPSCSQGCNIELHTRDDLVMRLKPRYNPEVNAYWMCDYGRYRYEWLNRPERVEAPLVRAEGELRAVGWGEALRELARRLGGAEGGVTALASPVLANEDLGALARLVEALGGGELLYRLPLAADEVVLPGFPTLARRRELAPNHRGAELLGFRRVGDDEGRGGLEPLVAHEGALLVVGDVLEDAPPDLGARAAVFVYAGPFPAEAARNAHFVLPTTTFAEQEGTFTNRGGRVQRFWAAVRAPGTARPPWQVLGAVLGHLGRAEEPAPSAAEAFRRLGEVSPAFRGLAYDDLGTFGAVLAAAPATAGE